MITKIYIGSNNESKVLEIDKIKSIINKYHDGYTIILAKGYWKGIEEDTAIIEIIDSLVSEDMIKELKEVLKQEAILVSRQVSDNIFM